MTGWLVVAALVGGWLIAYLRLGPARRAGILLMVASAAAALTFLRGWSALLWAAGPAAGTLLARRAPSRRLAFEPLMGRAAIAAAAAVVALIAAVRLPAHGTAWQWQLPAWLLLSTGLAWLVRPADEDEAAHGSTLAIAGGGALLAGVLPTGGLTLLLGGLMALVPAACQRGLESSVSRPLRARIYVVLAALTMVGSLVSDPSVLQRLGMGARLGGEGWAATAFLLAAGAAMAHLATLPSVIAGAVALNALHPALAWPALAAAVGSGRFALARGRYFWGGTALMALGLYAQAVLGGPVGERWQLALFFSGWLIVLIGAEDADLEIVPLFAVSGFALTRVTPLAAALSSRVAWLGFAAAVVVLISALSRRRDGWLQSGGTFALALVAGLSGTGLGAGASLLLLLGLVLVRARSGAPYRRLEMFLNSTWPPTCAFAGRVLAVIAAVAASPELGSLAVLLVATLTLFPARRRPPALAEGALRPLALTALSLGLGLTPAILLHLVRLFP